MRKSLPKKIFVCLIIFLLLCINYLSYCTVKNQKKVAVSGFEKVEREEDSFTEEMQSTEDGLIQYFVPQRSFIDNIQIRLAIYNPEAVDIDGYALKIRLVDEDDTVISEAKIGVEDLENRDYYSFEVNREVRKGNVYKIEIRRVGETNDRTWMSPFVCFISPSQIKEYRSCEVNEKSINGNIELIFQYSYYDWLDFGIIIGMDIVILLELIFVKRVKTNRIISIILYLLNPVYVFLTVEYLTSGVVALNLRYIFYNLVCYYILLFVATFLFRETKTAVLLYNFLFIVLALVDYYVLLFRGRPFVLFDALGFSTAVSVMDSYVYSIPENIAICLQVFLMLCVLVYYSLDISWSKSIRSRVTIVRLSLFFISCLTLGIFIKNIGLRKIDVEDINMWDIMETYKEKGFIYSLLLETKYINQDKPSEYSINYVKEIVAKCEEREEAKEIKPTNIIVIMNESLADLEMISEIKTEDTVLPFLHSMSDNVTKGGLFVPVFGAGTADSEYEVLTGNTKQFEPSGTVAYELYCHNPEYGLASTLKAQGFHTIAIHPYLADNWNRTEVYNAMQFDEYINIDNWESEMEYIRWCPSDGTAFNKIIDLIEKKKENEKEFIFLVTMQNHGGYVEDSEEDEATVKLKYDVDYPQAERYLALINESDAVFENLISYFSGIDEPTMVVMFGDHQPSLEEEFYDELFGKKWDDLSFEERQLKYKVPYIIWTNYEEKSCREDFSSNYLGSYILDKAGVKLTKYNEFLLQMKEQIPIIGIGGIFDKNGNFYSFNNLPEKYEQMIDEYRVLEYNNVFDHKNIVKDIFALNE